MLMTGGKATPQETGLWGLLVAVALIGIFIAAGAPLAPIVFIGGIVGVLFAYRYMYAALYAAIALTPFWGVRLSLPTGDLLLGKRAFGGSIDVSIAEVVFFAVLIAWSIKLVLFWWRRKDETWRPRLALIESYLALFFAHLSSVFSGALPDPILIAKFSLRPVLFAYLSFVALPVNLLKARRRFMTVLGILAGVGTFAALNGLVAMFVPGEGGSFLSRAHPYPLFGVNALGENHNSLADLMVFTVPMSLALAELSTSARNRRLLRFMAAFQFMIGLFTFARSMWIAFALQALFLVATEWRDSVKKHLVTLCMVGVLFLPLGVAMASYSVSRTAQSSNSTRIMLSEIALDTFKANPWFGAGAGSFVDRVGSTRVFLVEFGDPLDSHGFLQKILAETGLVGFAALCALVLQATWLAWQAYLRMNPGAARRAYALLMMAAAGALLYQLFDTDYWTGKLWLPLGILLAAMPILEQESRITRIRSPRSERVIS